MRGVLALALVVALVTAPAGQSHLGTARSKPALHLVLTSDRDGGERLYSVNPDGSRLSLVTQDRAEPGLMRAVTDGRRIVYTTFERTYVVGVDGRGLRAIAPLIPEQISPDTRWVVLSGGGIQVVRLDRRGARQLTDNRDDRFADWSPASDAVLVIRRSDADFDDRLFRIDIATGRTVELMRGAVYGARWSQRGPIAVDRGLPDGRRQLVLLNAAHPGAGEVVAEGQSVYPLDWSPDGNDLAYVDGDGAGVRVFDSRTAKTSVIGSQTVDSAVWSPQGDTLAVSEGSALEVFALDGSARARIRGGATNVHWARDGSRLAFERNSQIYVTTSHGSGLHAVTSGGHNDLVGWANGAVATTLRRAPALPASDIARGTAFRSRGEIAQIASSGRWAGIMVRSSPRDCQHVVAWSARPTRVRRFAPTAPCSEGDTGERWGGLTLTGLALHWYTSYCGNYCYLAEYSASVAKPGTQALCCEREVEDGTRPPSEPPDLKPHRGARMSLDAGTLTVRRASDGRTRRIGPRGGVVDAELEDDGLFYAYNVNAAYRGRVAFIPFDELFRR